MNIQILSDLHREVGIRKLEITGDMLILAGDITSAVPNNVSMLREWLVELGIPVLYILGNHEYYHGDVNTTLTYFREAFEGTNVKILNNDIVQYPEEDLVIIGSTLWTDIPVISESIVRFGMNDFRVIKNMTLDWWAYQFATSKDYIDYMLKEHCDKKNRIVITHHLPSFESIPKRFLGNSLNSGFSSDLSELILDREPSVWIHGHTHDSLDYILGKTRILCNPYGYKGYETNIEFKEDFILEI